MHWIYYFLKRHNLYRKGENTSELYAVSKMFVLNVETEFEKKNFFWDLWSYSKIMKQIMGSKILKDSRVALCFFLLCFQEIFEAFLRLSFFSFLIFSFLFGCFFSHFYLIILRTMSFSLLSYITLTFESFRSKKPCQLLIWTRPVSTHK